MQNFGQAYSDYINQQQVPEEYLIAPQVAPVDFSKYRNFQKSPEEKAAELEAYYQNTGYMPTDRLIEQQQETQQQATAIPSSISDYSQYGINYDVNGDGKVGIFEGISPKTVINNMLSFPKEIATGLVFLGSHPEETKKMVRDYYNDLYYKAQNTFGGVLGEKGFNIASYPLTGAYAIGDFYNANAIPYSLDSETYKKNWGDLLTGKATMSDVISRVTHRANEQAGAIGLDALTLGAGKLLKGVGAAGKAGKTTENALAGRSAKIAQETEKIKEAGASLQKNATEDLETLVRRSETGDWAGANPADKQLIKNYSNVVDDVFRQQSPGTYVEPEKLAITQRYVRNNNVTYQQAERTLAPYFDEMDAIKSAEQGVVTSTPKYTPNTDLVDDIKQFVKVEELPLEQPLPETVLRAGTSLIEQTPEVLAPLRKILTVEELHSLKNSTGEEVYNYIKKSKGLSDRQLSDLLYNNGIGGIDGSINKAFNAKKLGKIDKKTGDITVDPKADAATFAHEWEHKELLDAKKYAELGNVRAQAELAEVRRALNLADDVAITDKMLEDVSDAVSNFYRTGNLPEGALGEYIAKKYGVPQKASIPANAGANKAIKRLEELASSGDRIASELVESKKLFDKGDIFPITHGLAEVDKTAGIVDDIGRVMAGRFSTRAYGNAKYADIAREIVNPNDYINQLTKGYLDDAVKDMLRRGGTSDISIAPTNTRDAMYIPRQVLENEALSASKILEQASKQPLLPDDIAIDKNYLKALKDQYSLMQTNNPFGKTGLGDLYNLRKSTALASGGYLVGNLQTGLANAVINSNVGLIDDVINATLSKGRLAKNLGIYREGNVIKNTNVTPAGRALQEVNLRTGGYLLSKADSKMQNLFAEIAAHAELRRKGVRPSMRSQAIANMAEQQLGELVNDVKLVSLINPTRTITPRWLHKAGGVFNPFWRWTDTAAQSSLHMLNRHPVLANGLLVDVLARAGYDKEMQNRLGIGVELDKPFVSYKVNPKTGEPRELSMEYLPQMNTLKFGSELVDIIKGKGDPDSFQASIPLIGSMLMAFKGLNKYGKPMYRDHKSLDDAISIVGGKRYRLNPNTGLPEAVPTQWDEVFSAMANETLGSLSLFNRTAAPTAAWAASKLTGKDYEYYLPYGQALLGSFGERGQGPTEPAIPFLMAGDPTRPRSGQEVGNMLRGVYEQGYYPSSRLEQGIYNPTMLRNFYKGIGRRDMREMQVLQNR